MVDNQNKVRGFEGNGKVARFDSRGKAQYIHDDRRGVTISRGPGGVRQVMKPLPGGGRVMSTGPHRGFVEHRYVPPRGMRVPPGRVYVQRTYVINNVHYTRVYATYNYRGAPYYRYAPAAYYHPAYYGWAHSPWGRPVPYNWGWRAHPWYGYYGGYFTPAPVYPTPSLWLTDFLLAENLKAAYEARAAAQEQAAQPPLAEPAGGGMTPEVKQLIAQEVQAQLAEQQAAAQAQQAGQQPAATSTPAVADEVPSALSPKHRIFIVSSNLAVMADGQECALTPGDAISRVTDNPDENNQVTASVLSSKQGDCAAGQQVAVSVQDLQDMYNSFQEQLDSGLKTLASSSGKGGMPAAPDTGTIGGEVVAPPPDNDADAVLTDQQQAADQAEAELQKEAFTGNAGG
jgi:hypothetical protein